MGLLTSHYLSLLKGGLWHPKETKKTTNGEKQDSKLISFQIPRWMQSEEELKRDDRHARILCAFVGKTHTWVILDHNVLLTMRVGMLTRPFREEDLKPGSLVSILGCLAAPSVQCLSRLSSFGNTFGQVHHLTRTGCSSTTKLSVLWSAGLFIGWRLCPIASPKSNT